MNEMQRRQRLRELGQLEVDLASGILPDGAVIARERVTIEGKTFHRGQTIGPTSLLPSWPNARAMLESHLIEIRPTSRRVA